MPIGAVIFDLDGTVIADEEAYGNAFGAVLKDLGADVKEEYPHKGGIGVKENWPYLIEKYKIKTTKNAGELAALTQREFLKNLHTVELKDGFKDLADSLKELDVQIALATSNDWIVVEKILDKFELLDYFDCVVTGEEAAHKKPDPEIFLTASDKMSIPPEFCVVFEDSPAGVTAGKRAGMRVIAIARNEEVKEDLEKADLIITDFTEIKGADVVY